MKLQKKIETIREEIAKKVVGQEELVRDLLIGLLSGGHVLLEGYPGLAKTLSIETLSRVVDLDFSRIQFTPDLLPSDLLGAKIYNPENRSFSVKQGPIFSNLVLADEINRAPSKVQSALLEAMQEKQVTIGDASYVLDTPFMVLATQNPIEQDGTYSLPEAQLDRFLLKTVIQYPSKTEEIEIMKRNTLSGDISVSTVISKKEISELQKLSSEVFVSDNIYQYISDIVSISRSDEKIREYLAYGASPRASIALIKTAKTLALMDGRDFVTPEDIKQMLFPVLRHRIILNYEYIADGMRTDDVIAMMIKKVKIK